MTALLGAFALALAWCAALVTAVAALAAGWRGGESAVARWSAVVALGGAALAVGAIEWALVRHDFSVQFVAANGSRDTPLYYTVTSLWAAHDGSLLLWNLVLTAVLLLLVLRPLPGTEQLRSWAIGIVALVTAFFLGLAVFAGHVFDRVAPVPGDGPGPTPLLADHPAMGIHPPLLYLGLVTLVVPFGYGAAALVTGETGTAWMRAVTGPLRVAWTALTAGIVLGAWWSYAVLGWGGYWSWDPVENSSLMPWLLATALLHSLLLQRRTGALASWNLALAVLAFLLAAVGVVLTRSGAVASVHSFADSGVGPVLLGFVIAVTAAVLLLAVSRSGQGPPGGGAQGDRALSRGGALLLNNILLVTLTVTVLLGTLLPVAVEALDGQRISVGPGFYNRMAVPLGVLLLALMVVGPLLPWRRTDLPRLLRALAAPLVVGAGAVLAARLAGWSVVAAVACGLAAAAGAAAVVQLGAEVRRRRQRGRVTPRWVWTRRRVLGGRVAHLGLAVLAVGVAASAAGSVTAERTVARGDSLSVGDSTATLVSVRRARAGRSMDTGVVLRVRGGAADGALLRPQLRFFTGRKTTVAAPAIVSGVGGDLYATLLSVRQDGSAARVRLAHKPLVPWIWVGGALMALGGLAGVGSGRTTTAERRRRQAAESAVVERSVVR